MKPVARAFPLAGALATAAVSVTALAGWILAAESIPGGAMLLRTMRPATAICLLLASCSLLLSQRLARTRTMALILASISVAICAVAIAAATNWTSAALRIGPLNAISQCCVAIALVASGRKIGLVAAMGAASISILVLVGYSYGVLGLYESTPFRSGAMSTCVCMLLLCAGILFSERHQALSGVFFADSAAAVLFRRALPAAIAVPAAVGTVILAGWRAGWYGPQLGFAVFSVILILAQCLFVIAGAIYLSKVDRLRASAERENRERQDQLARSEASLRATLRAVSAASFDYDIASGKLAWSDGFHSLFGEERIADFSGWIAAIHPDDRERALAESRAGIQAGEGRTAYRIVRNGQVRWIEAMGCRIGANRFVGLTIDVTHQKRVEEELRQYRDMFQSASQAISLSMGAGATAFAMVNPAYARMHGYEVEEMAGMPIARVFPEDVLGDVRDAVRISNETGYYAFETKHVRKDGTVFPVLLEMTAVKDEQGTVCYRLSNIKDITESRRIEEHLRETAKLESIGVLAGGIAHDFNNILTGILGNASLLEETLPAGSEWAETARTIMRSSERAADLVRQMLAYSGKGRFVVTLIDLSQKIRETSALISTVIPRSAELDLKLAPELPPVEADPAQIQQVIMNLIINAAEALGEKPGRVTVTTVEEFLDERYIREFNAAYRIEPGRYVHLQVADSGSGMDAATLSKIFDPFFTTKFTGRGLGLSAVLGIVRGHRGALKVHSQPGVGTAFDVYLPSAGGEVAPPPEPGRTVRGKGTVLIVDDEELIRRTSASILEHAGFHVFCAENGHRALEVFRERPHAIDLVLLDLSMPNMNGEETLRCLRTIRPDVRVILSSGYGEPDAAAKFEEKGLAGFLQKPYSAATLAETVARLS
jgi:PAS domain S-box-containing protein